MRTEPNHKNGLKKRTVLDENGLIWAEGGGTEQFGVGTERFSSGTER